MRPSLMNAKKTNDVGHNGDTSMICYFHCNSVKQF